MTLLMLMCTSLLFYSHVQIQPAYDLTNNWYRVIVKLNNLKKHDDVINYSKYKVPTLFLDKNADSPIPVGSPVYAPVSTVTSSTSHESSDTSNASSSSATSGTASPDNTSCPQTSGASSVTGAAASTPVDYQTYDVRDLARRGSSETEKIISEFCRYLGGTSDH